MGCCCVMKNLHACIHHGAATQLLQTTGDTPRNSITAHVTLNEQNCYNGRPAAGHIKVRFGAVRYDIVPIFLGQLRITPNSKMFLFPFPSIYLITYLPIPPDPYPPPPPLPPAAQPAVPEHLVQVKSDHTRPMTPCWAMWHFCRHTSHLPKLACITLSHE